MVRALRAMSVVLVSGWLAAPVFAQMPGGEQSGVISGLSKIFGTHASFSAVMKMTAQPGDLKKPMALAVPMACLDGKVRTEMDLSKMAMNDQGALPVDIKALGLDRLVTLFLPEKKTAYMIVPGLKAYCETPVTGEGTPDKGMKMETTDLGREVCQGYDCAKKKMLVTETSGQQTEILVWQAAKLRDMPVQAVVKSGTDTATLIFTDYKFEKPAAALFTLPADYTKYNSFQELMMSAAMKMLPAAGKP